MSWKNARSASGFSLYIRTCAPLIMNARPPKTRFLSRESLSYCGSLESWHFTSLLRRSQGIGGGDRKLGVVHHSIKLHVFNLNGHADVRRNDANSIRNLNAARRTVIFHKDVRLYDVSYFIRAYGIFSDAQTDLRIKIHDNDLFKFVCQHGIG